MKLQLTSVLSLWAVSLEVNFAVDFFEYMGRFAECQRYQSWYERLVTC